jgi:hypothetical protein
MGNPAPLERDGTPTALKHKNRAATIWKTASNSRNIEQTSKRANEKSFEQRSQLSLLLPMLHREDLASRAAAARKNFAAVRRFASLQEPVGSKPPSPSELIQHSRERVQEGRDEVKGRSERKPGHPTKPRSMNPWILRVPRLPIILCWF